MDLLRSRWTKLLQEIGGESKLGDILADFYERMSKDAIIGFFFDGKDLAHIASMQKAFLLRAWGATDSYSGKSPGKAHENLAPILKGHFDRRLVLLKETLTDHGLSAEQIETWIGFESKFRAAVQSS